MKKETFAFDNSISILFLLQHKMIFIEKKEEERVQRINIHTHTHTHPSREERVGDEY